MGHFKPVSPSLFASQICTNLRGVKNPCKMGRIKRFPVRIKLPISTGCSLIRIFSTKTMFSYEVKNDMDLGRS